MPFRQLHPHGDDVLVRGVLHLDCSTYQLWQVLEKERDDPNEFVLAACDGIDAFSAFQPWFTKSSSR